MKTLEKNGYVQIIEEKVVRNPFIHKKIEKDEKLQLNEEQQQVFDTINFLIENDEYADFLIHGVTGSRKNRDIYATYRKCNK